MGDTNAARRINPCTDADFSQRVWPHSPPVHILHWWFRLPPIHTRGRFMIVAASIAVLKVSSFITPFIKDEPS